MVAQEVFEKKDKEEIEDLFEKLSNIDAEIAVIGSLLWDNRGYEKIADFLTEDHFTDLNNKKIFKIMILKIILI